MTARLAVPTSGGTAHILFTDRHDGDLAPRDDPAERDAVARALVDRPWSWVRQVHGADVVVVRHPGDGGVDGDGLVTTTPGAVLSVRGADCGIVAFVAANGVIGVAHAGWRGLVGGVLDATVAAMGRLGATDVRAHLGPCIHPCCYEFGAEELALVGAAAGADVSGRTRTGAPALDLPRALTTALARVGVDVDDSACGCTGCDERWFSHRARREAGRHAAVAWLGPAAP